ncbi:gamma-tubulin complex component 2 [Monocercomonoides exilis]|uniref:gamma-tubulin complex component 2 n=1 Tax=Monocercomonoides exilis TaxID=2049356 RepID=UPI00355A39AC|nr:gamma-tubulin complex component 2 [Monocercomonoides exilis]|eukprot:MONOS_6937.1-p1 / transcript=MONOS_6937.1 / gene=MONOS_6937 / organism=Monocercomonoides_exilis_PA203 / gene_product=gamma-tubulin complex component 2 / transcript_product=gamma-tubulin complex component 2 / location=Mono_scaffold00228:17308-19801(+) / protein_length=561 / sequence_SO=supercontig / SO=protein_coding / is_pseudo=false
MLKEWIYGGNIKDPYREFMVEPCNASVLANAAQTDIENITWNKSFRKRKIYPKILEGDVEKIFLCGKYVHSMIKMGKKMRRELDEEFEYRSPQTSFSPQINRAFASASRDLVEIIVKEKGLIQRLKSLKSTFLFAEGDFFVLFADMAESELKKPAAAVCIPRLEAMLDVALSSTGTDDETFREDYGCAMSDTPFVAHLQAIHEASIRRERHSHSSSSSQSRRSPSPALSTSPTPSPSPSLSPPLHTPLHSLSPSSSTAPFPSLSTPSQSSSASSPSSSLSPSVAVLQLHPPDSHPPSGFSALELTHNVSFPLNIVIDLKSLLKYQLIFRHIFLLKMVERRLCRIWKVMQMTKVLKSDFGGPMSVFGRCERLRQTFLHLIQNILFFTTQQVIEPAWKELMKGIATADRIEDLIQRHTNFIDNILKDSLMTNQTVITLLTTIEAQCLAFCDAVEEFYPKPYTVPDISAQRDPLRRPQSEAFLSVSVPRPIIASRSIRTLTIEKLVPLDSNPTFIQIIADCEMKINTRINELMGELLKLSAVEMGIVHLVTFLDLHERFIPKRK